MQVALFQNDCTYSPYCVVNIRQSDSQSVTFYSGLNNQDRTTVRATKVLSTKSLLEQKSVQLMPEQDDR